MRLSPAASGAGERASERKPALAAIALIAAALAVLLFLCACIANALVYTGVLFILFAAIGFSRPRKRAFS